MSYLTRLATFVGFIAGFAFVAILCGSERASAAGPGCIDYAPSVATISPCAGTYGTTIAINTGPKMTRPARELVFRPNFPALAVLQVRVKALTPSGKNYLVSGKAATDLGPALCAYGTKWNVFLLYGPGAGTLTEIGAYAIDCRPTPPPTTGAVPWPGGAGCVRPGPDAGIAPCEGSPGTKIEIYPQKKIAVPGTLVFTPAGPIHNALPGLTKLIAKVFKGSPLYYVPAPSELCVYSYAHTKWNVAMFDVSGANQGTVGIFSIDCTKTAPSATSGSYSTECGPTSKLVSISPCVGPVGTSIKVGTSPFLAAKPAAMAFRKVGSPGGPKIILPIKGSSTTATAALCSPIGPKYTVSILDSVGTVLGDAGTFTIICAVKGGPPPPPPPPSPPRTPSPSPSPKPTKKPTPKPTQTPPKAQGTQVSTAIVPPTPTPKPTPTPTPIPTASPPPMPIGPCNSPNTPVAYSPCTVARGQTVTFGNSVNFDKVPAWEANNAENWVYFTDPSNGQSFDGAPVKQTGPGRWSAVVPLVSGAGAGYGLCPSYYTAPTRTVGVGWGQYQYYLGTITIQCSQAPPQTTQQTSGGGGSVPNPIAPSSPAPGISCTPTNIQWANPCAAGPGAWVRVPRQANDTVSFYYLDPGPYSGLPKGFHTLQYQYSGMTSGPIQNTLWVVQIPSDICSVGPRLWWFQYSSSAQPIAFKSAC